MLFNSIEFLIFLPIVFVLYWFVTNNNLKAQNILLLVSSYVFYGWWDYRFLSLIVFSTLVDFFIGLNINHTRNKVRMRLLLASSIIANIGLLMFFKYYNFFIESWIDAFKSIGYSMDISTVSIILPVGISFYTFQTLSYTIDIYRRKLTPTNDFVAFAAFVAFFPQLVAGPIERASNLLPQVLNKRNFVFKQGLEGFHLMLWGFFKKLVIADSLGPIVNSIFHDYNTYSSFTLILGAVLFAFQIYCDFSGYTDIARGIAKLLGFELMVNFNRPYFSRSIGEFWRRWHISLSTWFRDYVYIPLGGSRVKKIKGIRNVFVIFLVSGFWHGANWTFIVWGGIHAIFFIPSFIFGTNRKYSDETILSNNIGSYVITILNIAKTFIIVTIAWVFFRADSIEIALDYLRHIFTNNGVSYFSVNKMGMASLSNFILTIFWLFYLMFIEYKQEKGVMVKVNVLSITSLILIILFFGQFVDNNTFIYFQF
jgi:alginate O-acetyltransferase complex protein AlgI